LGVLLLLADASGTTDAGHKLKFKESRQSGLCKGHTSNQFPSLSNPYGISTAFSVVSTTTKRWTFVGVCLKGDKTDPPDKGK
jgi:hypothetical protein